MEYITQKVTNTRYRTINEFKVVIRNSFVAASIAVLCRISQSTIEDYNSLLTKQQCTHGHFTVNFKILNNLVPYHKLFISYSLPSLDANYIGCNVTFGSRGG